MLLEIVKDDEKNRQNDEWKGGDPDGHLDGPHNHPLELGHYIKDLRPPLVMVISNIENFYGA